jgi:hypothetical protein
MNEQMGGGAKFLIGVGLGLVFIGVFWALGGKLPPIGRLPGDISVEKQNFKFYFPLTSSLLFSALFSLLMLVMSWFRNR